MIMEKDFDIVALGELNIDLILNRIGGFPEIGKEILAEDCVMTLGSSTAIFAANAASLGGKVAFLGMVGTDGFGKFIDNSLCERGVDTSMIVRTPEFNSGITVVMNYGQDRANVTYAGAMVHFGLREIEKEDFSRTRHVHISSIFLQDRLGKDLVGVLEHIKEGGATVSLDTQWDPSERWDLDIRKILPLIDVFMPNDKELMALTGKTSLEEAIKSVSGIANVLVVKRGSEGSTMVVRGESRRDIPALVNDSPVDCIGAGDSFNAGFIYAFAKGLPLDQCQDMGNLTGAISTTASGGTGAFSSEEKIRKAALTFGKEIKFHL